MEQRLKEAVERIVRPIPLEESVKNRMREELWGHLRERYESLRADGLEEMAAYDEAVRRLGEPKSVRRELFRSQSFMNRVMGWIDYQTAFRPGVHDKAHKWRLALLSFLSGVLLAAGSGTAAYLCGRPEEIAFLMILSLEMGCLYAGFVLVCAPLAERFYRVLTNAKVTAFSAARVYTKYLAGFIVGNLLMAASILLCGFALGALVASTSSSGWLFLLYVSPTILLSLAAIMGFAVPTAIAFDVRLVKPLPDWPYEKPLTE